jgi:hypothetical protein
MIPEERLEMLMQRAVDRELSSAQRHELLDAVAQRPDGWKQLACTFLEEQLVGIGVRGAATPAVYADELKSTVTPTSKRSAFWYQHPLMSSAVTICLAFVLGLAIPWQRTAHQPSVSIPTVLGSQTVNSDNGGMIPEPDEQLRREMEALRRALESYGRPRR